MWTTSITFKTVLVKLDGIKTPYNKIFRKNHFSILISHKGPDNGQGRVNKISHVEGAAEAGEKYCNRSTDIMLYTKLIPFL